MFVSVVCVCVRVCACMCVCIHTTYIYIPMPVMHQSSLFLHSPINKKQPTLAHVVYIHQEFSELLYVCIHVSVDSTKQYYSQWSTHVTFSKAMT